MATNTRWITYMALTRWPQFYLISHNYLHVKIHTLPSGHITGPDGPRQQGSWGQHGAHLGPVGPRWAPCWPHERCCHRCLVIQLVCEYRNGCSMFIYPLRYYSDMGKQIIPGMNLISAELYVLWDSMVSITILRWQSLKWHHNSNGFCSNENIVYTSLNYAIRIARAALLFTNLFSLYITSTYIGITNKVRFGGIVTFPWTFFFTKIDFSARRCSMSRVKP